MSNKLEKIKEDLIKSIAKEHENIDLTNKKLDTTKQTLENQIDEAKKEYTKFNELTNVKVDKTPLILKELQTE